jgi:biopolymer transport protein ExbD
VRLRPRRPSPAREPIIPLINVAFLMLVFMMLGATIEPLEPLPVELPVSTTDTPPERAAVVSFDFRGRLALDGAEVDRAALMPRLLAGRPTRVMLRVDGAASAQGVVELAQEIQASGVATVELATRRR